MTLFVHPSQSPLNHPDMQNYKILHKINKGSLSSIYKVEHIKTKQQFALKRIVFDDISTANQALSEIRYIQQLIKHPNIITYEDVFLDTQDGNITVNITMKYFEQGSLDKLIKKQKLSEKVSTFCVVYILDVG